MLEACGVVKGFHLFEDTISVLGLNSSIELLGISILAFVLGITTHIPLNIWFFKETNEISRAILGGADAFEKVVESALIEHKLVHLTLKNNQYYIAAIISNIYPERNDRKDLAILPFFSGYRDNDKHKVKITTDYIDIFVGIEEGTIENVTTDDLERIVRVSEIVSIGFFDLDLNDHFPDKYKLNLEEN